MTPRSNLLAVLIICSTTIALSGCGSWWLPRPHKINVQQGNLLDDRVVADIAEGMSKAEVQTRLGNPLLTQSFSPDRWDYIYSQNRSGEKPAGRQLTLFFSEGRVVSIEDTTIGDG